MASWASAMTHVLAGGTACVNHLNNPVYVGRMHIEGFDGPVLVRVNRATGQAVDTWETFSDTDILSDQWVQADGSPIPEPEPGSFGAVLDMARGTPGLKVKPEIARAGMGYWFDGAKYLLQLPNGLDVRPAFPVREMRCRWELV